jgi:putative ABC transport system permease protein
MPVPLSYNARSILVRWRVALLAALGIALVVAVFAGLLAISEGFATALRTTGRPDNAIIVQRGSTNERMSQVPLADRNLILADDRLARGPDGRVLASWEWLVSLVLPRRADDRATTVTLRGVPPQAFAVRGGVRLIAGRLFTPGLAEVIVGRRILERVAGLQPGGTVRHGRKELAVVGIFESDGGAFESEGLGRRGDGG